MRKTILSGVFAFIACMSWANGIEVEKTEMEKIEDVNLIENNDDTCSVSCTATVNFDNGTSYTISTTGGWLLSSCSRAC